MQPIGLPNWLSLTELGQTIQSQTLALVEIEYQPENVCIGEFLDAFKTRLLKDNILLAEPVRTKRKIIENLAPNLICAIALVIASQRYECRTGKPASTFKQEVFLSAHHNFNQMAPDQLKSFMQAHYG